VRLIEETGALDEASAQALREMLRAFAQTFAVSAPPPKAASKP